MSDERHETVADIVADIRAQNQGLPEDGYALSPLAGDLLSIADRIEAAVEHERATETADLVGALGEQSVTNRNRLGNDSKTRVALEQIHALLSIGGKTDTAMCIRYEAAYQLAEDALSAPPRNCDKYTLAESLRKYGFPTKSKPWGEKEWLDFCEWYISEAKGATDGSK